MLEQVPLRRQPCPAPSRYARNTPRRTTAAADRGSLPAPERLGHDPAWHAGAVSCGLGVASGPVSVAELPLRHQPCLTPLWCLLAASFCRSINPPSSSIVLISGAGKTTVVFLSTPIST